MQLSTPRRIASIACVMTTAVLVAACGDSDGDASSSATSSQDNAANGAVEQARADVEELSSDREFEIEPLSGEVPAGKTVAWVNCTIPVCTPGGMDEPVEALGWTLETFDYDLTKGTQDYLRALDAAIASGPDYLALNFLGTPDLVTRQLELAKSEGIVVIGAGTEDTPGVEIMVQSPDTLNAAGSDMADIALADAGGPVNIAMPGDFTFGTFTGVEAGLKSRLAEAEGSSLDRIEVSLGQPQPTNVAAIINYVKANPDTDYLVFTGTALYPGIDQALQAAGLEDSVKLIMSYPFPQDLEAVQDGQWSGVLAGESTHQWRQVDAMARLAAGDPIEDRTPTGDFRIVTPETATVESFDPPDYEAVYKKAWGV